MDCRAARSTRGSLADAAMWDQKCDACHVGFHPVRDGTVAQLLAQTAIKQTIFAKPATRARCIMPASWPPRYNLAEPATKTIVGAMHRWFK